MGSSEDMTSPKSEKASPSRQVYYGPGVPLPQPYLNSAVMVGHVPHPHPWGPPQVMQPYGVPYLTNYSPGVVYTRPAVPLGTTPVSMQPLSKSFDSMDQGLTKKLKRLDGIVLPVDSGGAEIDGEGSVQGASLRCSKASGKTFQRACYPLDERQLKREKRKLDNRESARRSRLRKQVGTEEVMKRYETLELENIDLVSEIDQLMEESEKLRIENAALMERLNDAEVGELVFGRTGPDITQPNRIEDGLLLNNSGSVTGDKGKECETLLGNSNSEMKLQKFESRADAVATS